LYNNIKNVGLLGSTFYIIKTLAFVAQLFYILKNVGLLDSTFLYIKKRWPLWLNFLYNKNVGLLNKTFNKKINYKYLLNYTTRTHFVAE
jgi:hypothetical protein